MAVQKSVRRVRHHKGINKETNTEFYYDQVSEDYVRKVLSQIKPKMTQSPSLNTYDQWSSITIDQKVRDSGSESENISGRSLAWLGHQPPTLTTRVQIPATAPLRQGSVEESRSMLNLKGENQIGRFRKIAEKLALEIAEFEGVAAIVVAGGLERGFADRYSDVDILVFLRNDSQVLRRKILKLGSEEQKNSSVDVDLEVHVLDDFRRRRTNEIHKWDLRHMQIAFDPQGEMKQLLRQKTKVPCSFWVRKIAVCSEYLKWYCCPPKADVGTVAEAWVKRGGIVSAHYCLNYGLDLIVDIVYALNREFVPSPKWKLFYSYSLKWLPKDYCRLVKKALHTRALSVKNFNSRLSALRGLWQENLPEIEEQTGLTPPSVSKYFVERVLRRA